MERWRVSRRSVSVAAVLASLVAAIPAVSARADTTALFARLPDGRRINLRCAGAGAPTVLLESGYEGSSLAWSKVQPIVARTTRVCAYDRAGLGLSDPGPLPRDGAAIAADLDQALRAAHIAGPFVVVGHSAGGLYVRLFADRRPRDVVGMVLVESSVEHQDRAFARAFGPRAGSVQPLIDHARACLAATRPGATRPANLAPASCGAGPASQWRTNLSEIETLFTATSDDVERGRRSYGAMPIVVLTAGDAYADIPDARARRAVLAFWAGLHQGLAAMSSRGSAQLVAGATHMIILDHPAAVAAAIDEVVVAVRGRSGARPPKR